jgi:membrane protein
MEKDFLYLPKKDYKPKEVDIEYKLKDKLKLFSEGFKGIFKNGGWFIVHLFFFFIFAVSLFYFSSLGTKYLPEMGYQYTQFVLVPLIVYFGQQLFITNFVFKSEELYPENSLVRYIKQLKTLFLVSFVFSFIAILSVYAIHLLLNYAQSAGGIVEVMSYFASLFSETKKALIAWLIIFSMFIISAVLLYASISANLIFISELQYPVKINIFRRYYRGMKKAYKMFDVFSITIAVHAFLLFSALLIAFFLTSIIGGGEAKTNAEMMKEFIVGASYVLPFFFVVVVYLTRAKIKSLIVLFFLTEDLDEYDERLTYPIKEEIISK